MEIIGQKKLLNIIDKRINNNKLARFIIIDGVHGSGKKLISSYIADTHSPNLLYICGQMQIRCQ